MTDNRDQTRYDTSVLIERSYDGIEEFRKDYLENISIGGMYFCSEERLSVGDNFRFRFEVGSVGALIEGVGLVVWTKESGDMVGHGVQFVELSPESKAYLEAFLQEEAE